LGTWRWSLESEQVGAIGLRAEAERIVLTYGRRVAGEPWQHVEEPLPIVRAPPTGSADSTLIVEVAGEPLPAASQQLRRGAPGPGTRATLEQDGDTWIVRDRSPRLDLDNSRGGLAT
jgi:hypothetical protein